MKFYIFILLIFVCFVSNLPAAAEPKSKCPFARIESIHVGTGVTPIPDPDITPDQARQILEVAPGDDFKAIKKKYQKLMLLCSSDKNIGEKDRANRATQKINLAYEFYEKKESRSEKSPEKYLSDLLKVATTKLDEAINNLKVASRKFNNISFDASIRKAEREEGLKMFAALTQKLIDYSEVTDVNDNLTNHNQIYYAYFQEFSNLDKKIALEAQLAQTRTKVNEYLNLYVTASFNVIIQNLKNENQILRINTANIRNINYINITDILDNLRNIITHHTEYLNFEIKVINLDNLSKGNPLLLEANSEIATYKHLFTQYLMAMLYTGYNKITTQFNKEIRDLKRIIQDIKDKILDPSAILAKFNIIKENNDRIYSKIAASGKVSSFSASINLIANLKHIISNITSDPANYYQFDRHKLALDRVQQAYDEYIKEFELAKNAIELLIPLPILQNYLGTMTSELKSLASRLMEA